MGMHIVLPLPHSNQPVSAELMLDKLGRIFNNTSTSYKFWWFAALLHLHAAAMHTHRRQSILLPASAVLKPPKALSIDAQKAQILQLCAYHPLPAIPFWRLAALMAAKAWYPQCFFHLRFGLADQIPAILDELEQLLNTKAPQLALKEQDNEEKIYLKLCQGAQCVPEIKKCLLSLTRHVPYRLLSPWISYKSDGQVIAQSKLEPHALYQIEIDAQQERAIAIHPLWQDYLVEHYAILQDFTDFALVEYLERRNPNIPNIAHKLRKIEERAPLNYAHTYFDAFLHRKPGQTSIYTGKPLPPNYALDHFIPWSFVAHNELWNLAPIEQSSNSSKSNKLPDLDCYLPKLAQVQYEALKTNEAQLMQAQSGDFAKARESLCNGFGERIENLEKLSLSEFGKRLHQLIYPLYLQAQSLNFELWQPAENLQATGS